VWSEMIVDQALDLSSSGHRDGRDLEFRRAPSADGETPSRPPDDPPPDKHNEGKDPAAGIGSGWWSVRSKNSGHYDHYHSFIEVLSPERYWTAGRT